MSDDWFERKLKQIAGNSERDNANAEVKRHVFASAPYFWGEIVGALNEGAEKWNRHKGRTEVWIQDAGGPVDTLSVNVIGPDARMSAQFRKTVPQIAYGVEASTEKGILDFVFESQQVRVKDKGGKKPSLSASETAGLFLDFIVKG
jgi:hypothetical protein